MGSILGKPELFTSSASSGEGISLIIRLLFFFLLLRSVEEDLGCVFHTAEVTFATFKAECIREICQDRAEATTRSLSSFLQY